MGIDWNSPETMSALSAMFDNSLFALMGLYAWEWVITLDFEWEFVSGRRKFRWPMIFYFYARYAVLALFAGIIVARFIDHPINCNVLFAFITSLGTTALGAASLNLAIRSMAVWGNDRLVVIGLSILLAGQFVAILRSVPATVGGSYVEGTGCVIVSAQADIFAAMYTVTMVVDFVILSLTAYKTYIEYRNMYHSGLIKLIFRDGLAYFFVVFLSNLFAMIFSLLNLNPIMAVAANGPSSVFATIGVCRLVRRLNRYVADTPQIPMIPYSLPTTRPHTHRTLSEFEAVGGVRVETTIITHTNSSSHDGDLERGRISRWESHNDPYIDKDPAGI
ncbi:hypothetical protein PM082_014887 [Marasmius tenuissimus]|nr:hypothetical protein PM082_014887 [Marasmius tenuissimus]